ncbi:MAG: SDR family oxidoreductase [Rhodospirillales bacterium]|nr:SDR family oxidoreductase [Rhodospirillales bacterium]
MTNISLTGKTAMVTGAGRGLGREMANSLLSAGASVALVELDLEPLQETSQAAINTYGEDRVIALSADVTDDAAVADAVAAATGKFGGVDILVNNAALGPQSFRPSNLDNAPKVWEVDPDIWRRVQLINATGPFIMSRTVLPAMIARGWGRIINVTTSLDTMYRATIGPYGPSKAALEALTAVMAEELEGTGVTANVLVPGGRANTRMIPDDGVFEDRSLLVKPEVMAAPIRWLASDASNGFNNMRFRGALWDPDLPIEEAIEASGAPVAWPQLGAQAIRSNL